MRYTQPPQTNGYKARLEENLMTLQSLLAGDIETCPELAKLLNAHGGSLGRKLMILHQYFLQYGDVDRGQVVDLVEIRGRRDVIMMASLDHLVTVGRGSKATWKSRSC